MNRKREPEQKGYPAMETTPQAAMHEAPRAAIKVNFH
jgi:hypothetical protein